MMNMIEKKFFSDKLEIVLSSFIDKQQNVWFRGKDVAKILGYRDTKKAINQHASKENKIIQLIQPNVGGYKTPSPQQNDTRGKYCNFVNEPGFYELVLSSKLEAVKKFRQWLFTTVLPSIRKYGYYKLFKNENRASQRFIIGGKKYYKHPVFANYAASKNGKIVNVKTGRIKKMSINGSGYLFFTLYDKKLEKPKNYRHHRFVYEVFKGPIPRCLEIDHINNCKTDNRNKNLQIISHYQNVGKSKNKSIIAINIKTCEKKEYVSITKAAIELGISISYISQICNQVKNYKSATSKKDGKKYTFKFHV